MHSKLSSNRNFNPRSPWGERRDEETEHHNHLEISIHAPRGGSDINSV